MFLASVEPSWIASNGRLAQQNHASAGLQLTMATHLEVHELALVLILFVRSHLQLLRQKTVCDDLHMSEKNRSHYDPQTELAVQVNAPCLLHPNRAIVGLPYTLE